MTAEPRAAATQAGQIPLRYYRVRADIDDFIQRSLREWQAHGIPEEGGEEEEATAATPPPLVLPEEPSATVVTRLSGPAPPPRLPPPPPPHQQQHTARRSVSAVSFPNGSAAHPPSTSVTMSGRESSHEGLDMQASYRAMMRRIHQRLDEEKEKREKERGAA